MDVEARVDTGTGELQPGHHLLLGLEAVPLTRGRAGRELARLSFDSAERGLEAFEAAPGGLRTGPDGQDPGAAYFRWSIGT
jgi:hypothetical protein